MQIKTIGVMSPGDMGQAVAAQLKLGGFTLHTALDERSARSKALAHEAGLIDVGSVEKLVASCDVILSIMNPAAALEFGLKAAAAIAAGHGNPIFVDCNAISPATLQQIEAAIVAAGGRCLDGTIIGSPPRDGARCNLYFAGPGADTLAVFAGPHLNVRILGARSGDASALKMCCL